jgi:hypothetical protein
MVTCKSALISYFKHNKISYTDIGISISVAIIYASSNSDDCRGLINSNHFQYVTRIPIKSYKTEIVVKLSDIIKWYNRKELIEKLIK